MKISLENFIIIAFLNLLFCFLLFTNYSGSNDSTYNIKLNSSTKTLENLNFSPTPSKCVVHPNIYTPEEVKTIFRYKNLNPCKPFTNDEISFINGTFKVKCFNTREPKYGVDSSNIEVYGGSIKELPKWKSELPPLGDKQFVFVKCSISAIYGYVFNRFNQKVSDSANGIRMKLGKNEKPMNVLLLVLDSVSRYSFQRNLPKTNNFLKKLYENKEFNEVFSVFEFEKSATPKAFTIFNMAQIIFGKKVEDIEKVVGSDPELLQKNKEIYLDYQNKNAIWNHFSSLGYVTMFSHASVFDYLPTLTGKYIQADHVFTNYWRYLWGISDISNYDEGKKCFGGKNMHEFLFDYAYQFFENYPNNNKFAYVHSDAAHENSGNVRTVDSDLLKFLTHYLRLIKSRNENLAIFLLSDHGHKRLEHSFKWDLRTLFEFHTPFTFLIASKDVIRSLNAFENLKHNEIQLISRFDINLSLKHLAYAPYNFSLNAWYPEAKSYYTYNNTVSLFEEKVSVDRTCADIGVKKEYCLCSWFEPVEYNENEARIEKEMLDLFSQYLFNSGKLKNKCSVFKRMDKIKISSFPLRSFGNGLDTLYKIESQTVNKNQITMDFNFCFKRKLNNDRDILLGDEHPYSFFELSNITAFIQLDNLNLPPDCVSNFCEC